MVQSAWKDVFWVAAVVSWNHKHDFVVSDAALLEVGVELKCV